MNIAAATSAAGLCLAAVSTGGLEAATAFDDMAEPRVAVARTAAPVVDGSIGEKEWRDAVRMVGLCFYRRRDVFPAEASFMLKQDGEKVYVAGRCVVPPDGLVRKVMARPRNTDAFADDCFELVFIDDVEAKNSRASHLIANFNGALRAARLVNGRSESWKAWQSVETKSSERDGFWEFEVSVPFADVGFTPGNSRRHAIRVCRDWWRADDSDYAVQTSWSQADGPFLSVARAPRVAFVDDAPVVRCESLAPDASGASYVAEFSVLNPGKTAVTVDCHLRGVPVNSQPGERREVIRLEAGERKSLSLKAPVLDDEKVSFSATFVRTSDSLPLYVRRFDFAPNEPRIRFRSPGSKGEASLRFAYFPSYNRARVAVDLAGCADREKVTALRLCVRDTSGAELADIPLGKGAAVDRVVDMPDLAACTRRTGKDDYVAVLVADGAPGIKAEQPFKRGVFDWEGNRLGLSDSIPDPFIPVKREGDHVKVVLRDHTIGPLGLWEQVKAASKDVLAGPMRIVSASTSEPISLPTASASSDWDVDGLMDWRLTLKPGHYEPMKLVVPVRGEIAKLYHSCADGIRYNPAGAIPPGVGRVWESSTPPRTSIVGSYLPYIWIGGPLRGIAAFGENDSGWETDGETPCQEIVRERDGSVSLVLNLIQRPVDVKSERTIRIGFMATPVKPMQPNWRALPHGVLMASWFVYGVSSNELSPYDGKDDFLRKMAEARRTGKVDTAYLENYIRSYPSPWPEGSEKRRDSLEFLERHWRSGMNRSAMSYKKGDVFVFYTNPRGVPLGMPPGTTYADEWDRQQWTVRGGNREAGHAYDNDPVASYRDYAAWWYRRMIETGAADAVYWDNVFCQSDFNLVGTAAYVLPGGDIQPASGIFAMRALIRRCAVVMAELGKSPRNNWVHMTNTAMAPICAFVGVDYDWEDTSGDSAIQERYSREYIQAASIGRQFGNRVGVMGYFACDFVPEKDRDKKKQAWLHHTGTGACLTHELEWRRVPEWQAAIKRLRDWGYSMPDTKVWNYWDEDVKFPVAITGGENAALAMARDGKALVILSDWKAGGDYRLRPDVAALGIPRGFRAFDHTTGRELPVSDGVVQVGLDRLDYVVVELR